jgi:hypothetical protein
MNSVTTQSDQIRMKISLFTLTKYLIQLKIRIQRLEDIYEVCIDR